MEGGKWCRVVVIVLLLNRFSVDDWIAVVVGVIEDLDVDVA